MSVQERARLRFADRYIGKILDGEKYATIRLGCREPTFSIGRTVELCDADDEPFHTVTIEDRDVANAVTIAEYGVEGHADYASATEVIEAMAEFYPDQNIDIDTQFDIIRWDPEEVTR